MQVMFSFQIKINFIFPLLLCLVRNLKMSNVGFAKLQSVIIFIEGKFWDMSDSSISFIMPAVIRWISGNASDIGR